MKPPIQLPDRATERLAIQLSADVYLPLAELRGKYPSAAIHEAGCDRALVVLLDGRIWVVWMGTHDRLSLLSDFDMKRVRVLVGDQRQALECHEGFTRGVRQLWSDVTQAIAVRRTRNDLITVTGHSRGASEAIIFSAEFYNHGLRLVDCVLAFAPARPGNAAFRDWYDVRLGNRTVCYQHGADVVCWETPFVLGNRHVGHRIFFPDHTGTLLDRVVDPSLIELGVWCGLRTAQGFLARPPQFEQLLDHHVSTYVKLLTQ